MDIESVLTNLGFIMSDPEMHAVKHMIAAAAASPVEVLIQGETGTGKEMVVKAIKALNTTRKGALVAVDCSIFEGSQVIESVLFGHKRGAFTGAYEDKAGVFEEAENGFLFLDEIHNLPINQQNKFLRALQEQQGKRMGCHMVRKYNFRLICATNKNLKEEVEQGAFKADLYHRINCITIELPPLRKRITDIPAIACHLLFEETKKFDKESPNNQFQKRFFPKGKIDQAKLPFHPDVIALFMAYRWSGNVRELNNEIRHILTYLSITDNEMKNNMIMPTDCSSQVRNFNSKTYLPQPLNDVPNHAIPEYALELTELLAKNGHDIWAKQRIGDGWTFGVTRDDVHKKHPCLIEYEKLPDSEKEYDRLIVLGIIKALLSLGYSFSKKEEDFADLIKLGSVSMKEAVTLLECKMMSQALEKTDYNQTQAAKILGISREAFVQKLNDTDDPIRKNFFQNRRKRRNAGQ